MLGEREPKQPMRHPAYDYYLLSYSKSEDSTFVEEHCELLMLQPCLFLKKMPLLLPPLLLESVAAVPVSWTHSLLATP